MVKIAQIIENTDLQEAKKYVSIYCIYQNTSEFNNMIKLLENVVGQIFIVCPLVTPEKKTGYILSIYKEFLFLVTLSDDNLLSEKQLTTILSLLIIAEVKYGIHHFLTKQKRPVKRTDVLWSKR